MQNNIQDAKKHKSLNIQYKQFLPLLSLLISPIMSQAESNPSTPSPIKVTGVEYGSRSFLFETPLDPSRLAPEPGQTQIQMTLGADEYTFKNSSIRNKLYIGIGRAQIEMAKSFDSGLFVGGRLNYFNSKGSIFNRQYWIHGLSEPKITMGFRQDLSETLIIYRLDYAINSGPSKSTYDSESSRSNVLIGGSYIQPSVDLRYQFDSDFEIGGRVAASYFEKTKHISEDLDEPEFSYASETTNEPAYMLDLYSKFRLSSTVDLSISLGKAQLGKSKTKETAGYSKGSEYKDDKVLKLNTLSISLPVGIDENLSILPQISSTAFEKYVVDETDGTTNEQQIYSATVSVNYGF